MPTKPTKRPNEFGSMLRSVRKRQRVTAMSLAVAVGRSREHILAIESGWRRPPAAAIVKEMATHLRLGDLEARVFVNVAGLVHMCDIAAEYNIQETLTEVTS